MWRIYLYGWLQSLFFDQFLWFVYLLHLGYSPARIGLGCAIYQAVRLVFDVPGSWLGDRLGPRNVFYAGAAAKTVSSLAFLCGGRGFGWIAAGFAAAGLGMALPSGVDLAYLHTVAGPGAPLSRYTGLQYAASLAAGLAGGILAARSFHVLYLADAMVGLVTLAVVWSLPRGPVTDRERPAQGFWWRSYVDAAGLLRRSSGGFRLAAGVAVVVWSSAVVQSDFSQGLLRTEGLGTAAIPLIFAAASFAGLAGAWLAGRLQTTDAEAAGLAALVWLGAVSGFLRALNPGPWASLILTVGGIAAGRVGSGLGAVLLSGRLLREAPERSRATALSAVNTLQMLLMLVLFPVSGLLAADSGLHAVFGACGGVLTVAAVLVTAGLRRRS